MLCVDVMCEPNVPDIMHVQLSCIVDLKCMSLPTYLTSLKYSPRANSRGPTGNKATSVFEYHPVFAKQTQNSDGI